MKNKIKQYIKYLGIPIITIILCFLEHLFIFLESFLRTSLTIPISIILIITLIAYIIYGIKETIKVNFIIKALYFSFSMGFLLIINSYLKNVFHDYPKLNISHEDIIYMFLSLFIFWFIFLSIKFIIIKISEKNC